MVEINIIEEEGTLEISIKQSMQSKLKVILLSLLSMVSLLFFVVLFFTSPLRFSALIFMFFTVFFLSFRSLLWQINGKEKIKITPSQVNQIIDFGWFDYKTVISNENVELEIALQKLLKGTSEEILDSDLEKYQRDGIIRFKKNKNVLIEIEAVIPSTELGKIENLIQAYLK